MAEKKKKLPVLPFQMAALAVDLLAAHLAGICVSEDKELKLRAFVQFERFRRLNLKPLESVVKNLKQ